MARKIGVILLGVITIIALGLSGYTFITTQFIDSGQKVVGIWEEVEEITDYSPFNTTDHWLIELSDNSYLDSSYITVSNTGTRMNLIKAGWYRIQMTFLLISIDAGFQYWIELLKNGNHDFYLDYHLGVSGEVYHEVHANGYVLSDGNDYIELTGRSNLDAFTIYTHASLDFNQLAIEFVLN